MVRIAISGVFALALAFASGIASAQATVDTAATDLPERPLFRIFGTAQGLPSSTVHKLARDRAGNLWIATLDGLARFDGVEFKVWRHDPDVEGSLPGNDVQQVVVDEDDRVWLAIQDAGIARYDETTNTFLSWRHDAGDPASLSSDRIWALADDGLGGVWAGGYRSGLLHLHADGRIEHFRHDANDSGSLCDDIVLALARVGDALWIGTAKGLCRWRPDGGFSTVSIPIDPAGATTGYVADIEADGDRLWLATSTGLRLLPLDGAVTGLPLPPALADVPGNAVTVEPDGELWYASAEGVRRWRVGSDEPVFVHDAQPGRSLALQAPSFLDVLRDREGSLWFASEGGGLAQLLPHWRAIRVFLPNRDDPAALPGGRVRLVSVDADGQIWVAANYDDGVAQLDPITGLARRWFTESGDGITRPDPTLLAVLHDRSGRLWTGNRGRVGRFDMASGDYRSVATDSDGAQFPTTMVRRLAALDDGHLLAAFGGGGVARIDSETLSARFDPLGDSQRLPCAEIADIRIDRHGRPWLACERGVLRGTNGGDAFEAVPGAPDAAIDGLGFTSDGDLWLHSIGQLIQFRVDEDGGLVAVRSVDANDGWPVVRAGGLVVDGDGIVWATTSRGLYSYDPDSHRVAAYDENDGLPSAEFSPTPPASLSPHLFAAGTVAGPVIVDTRRLRQPLPKALLRWHEASIVRDTRIHALAIGVDETIELAYDDRDLRVSVRLDSFANPAAHRFRFRLDGYDEAWQLSGQPERVFERLPSGSYTLHVEAIGSDGQPAGNVLSRSIGVGLPPWRQPWAIALYALLFIVLVYTLQRAYRLRLEERHALELAGERQHWAEQASEAKTRFLASVGHEIRTPMAGLLGMNSLLLDSRLDARQRHYAQSVGQAGSHMLALVNDLLDLSRIEAGQLSLEPAPVDLVQVFDSLIGDAAASAEKKGLHLSSRIESGTPLAVLADGKRLKQVLLNFLSNAIKFTLSGRIRLVLRMVGEGHEFAVEDEGPGLSREMREKLFTPYSQDALGRSSGGTGLGLSIAQELARLMGGDVGVDLRTEVGSRFWLRVPLSASMQIACPDARGLPPLIIVDRDRHRGDDLAESLRAVGARGIILADGNDWSAPAGTVALVAEGDGTLAAVERDAAKRPGISYVLSVPLAGQPAVGLAHSTALAGPWRIGAVVDAVVALDRRQMIRQPATGERRDAAASPADPALHETENPRTFDIVPLPQDVEMSQARPDLSGVHILIVEDDAILRDVLSERIKGMGATIDAVENGLLALAALSSSRVDLVLLDLDLPQIDGVQLLGLMASRFAGGAPPVIVVTARQQPDDERQCRAAGAVDFFRKPVPIDALARRIHAITARG
jgi:signal transduction histidine kinase/ligand-binding sensor domain-containing protein/CheY-like chemotaxis protein